MLKFNYIPHPLACVFYPIIMYTHNRKRAPPFRTLMGLVLIERRCKGSQKGKMKIQK